MISNFSNGPITVKTSEKFNTTCAHPGLHFDQKGIGNGTVLIENSKIVGYENLASIRYEGNNGNARFAKMILRNITLARHGLVIKPGTERNEMERNETKWNETKRNEMEKIVKSVGSGVV